MAIKRSLTAFCHGSKAWMDEFPVDHFLSLVRRPRPGAIWNARTVRSEPIGYDEKSERRCTGGHRATPAGECRSRPAIPKRQLGANGSISPGRHEYLFRPQSGLVP